MTKIDSNRLTNSQIENLEVIRSELEDIMHRCELIMDFSSGSHIMNTEYSRFMMAKEHIERVIELIC